MIPADAVPPTDSVESLSPEDVRRALHDLRIHQIELEQQNEELRRVHLELDASRARYFDLYDLAPVGYLTVSERGLILEANLTVASLLGVTRTDLVKQRLSQFVFKDHESIYYLRRNQLFASREPQAYDVRMVKKDGTVFWAHIDVTASQEAAGELVCRMTLSDITERKQAEAAEKAIEAWQKALMDHVGHAIIATTPDGVIQTFNTAAERMLGYTAKDMVGIMTPACIHDPHEVVERARTFSEELGEPIEPGFDVLVAKTRRDLPNEHEWTYVHKDGTRFPVMLTVTAVRNSTGHLVGFLGLAQDITERKRADEALRETNYALEAMTWEAHEMAFKAQLASAAKSDFLANMSHEIRTPMNGVIGMTGLLLDTVLNDEQRKYAETVRASGESLLSLINDILDFSKIEAGKLELETMDFDVRVMLDDFAAMLALRAEAKGLEFICAAAPDVPSHLRGDPGRVRQILINLAGNAIKFTAKGEVAVRASLESETEADAVVRFSVRDTGIGIPADKQDMLFQKFTQVDAATTRQYGGTGLGLAISKQLAELMGGQVGLESVMGEGSVFWFTASFAKQANRAPDVAVPVQIRGTRILVVDDSATNRDVLTAQLRSWGVRSGESEDGVSALRALCAAKEAGDPFKVAIIDMQTPGMDGMSLGRTIKADDGLKETQLVMMTSFGKRGDAKLLESIGFAAYFTKPTRQLDLFDSLSVVLSGAAVARPLVTKHTVRELRQDVVRILLAEDNITNQLVAKGILKKLGLRVDVVANGVEALKSLTTLPYDLVLMDVQMPEMNGLEATRAIRDPQSAVPNHKIPVIAMTAGAMQGDREMCLSAGMDDYVTKPISPQALADVLDRWLPTDRPLVTAPAEQSRD